MVNEGAIADPDLADALRLTVGKTLTDFPQIPFAFVPESQPAEIRRGLVDFVMSVFKPGSHGVETKEIVNQGLERLSGCVSVTAKAKLKGIVETELRNLLSGDYGLREDLQFSEGRLSARDGFTWHPKRLERVQRALRTWSGAEGGKRQTSILNYGSSP